MHGVVGNVSVTGWNVPAPTCSVTLALAMPRASACPASFIKKMQRSGQRNHGAGFNETPSGGAARSSARSVCA
jgi:hypothetical protein